MFFELLTHVKSNRLREYKEFMNEEDSRDIVNIFLKKKAPSILESEEFRNWENEKYSALLFNKRLKKQVDNIKRDLQLSQQQT